MTGQIVELFESLQKAKIKINHVINISRVIVTMRIIKGRFWKCPSRPQIKLEYYLFCSVSQKVHNIHARSLAVWLFSNC